MPTIDKATVERRVATFLDACRAKGIKATHQRGEIVRALASTDEHPDAETLFRRVRERVPTMALDTVYRTLHLLEESGIVSRVGSTRERARFDANTQRHHHFVCTRCGLIRDFQDAALDRPRTLPDVPEMVCVDTVYVELRGRCRSCRKRGEGKGSSRPQGVACRRQKHPAQQE